MTLGIVTVFNGRGLVYQGLRQKKNTYFLRESGLGSRRHFAHGHHFHVPLLPGGVCVV